jgi:hypothetical protein
MYRHTNTYQPPSNYSQIRDIWLACKLGLIRDVQYLLSTDPQLLTEPDQYDNTPLYIAASGGHYELVKYLSEKGARDDIYRRAYLSSLNLPVRHLIVKFNPVHINESNPKNKKKKEEEQKEEEEERKESKSLEILLNYFVEVNPKSSKKLDDGMGMGGVLFFELTPTGEKPKKFRCHLMLLLARWKNFTTMFLGKTKEEIEERIKEIKESNMDDHDTRDHVQLGDVHPNHFKIILQYIYSGGAFVRENGLKSSILDIGSNHHVCKNNYTNFKKLYDMCHALKFDEILSILDLNLQMREIDISHDVEFHLKAVQDNHDELHSKFLSMKNYLCQEFENALTQKIGNRKKSAFEKRLEKDLETQIESEKNMRSQMEKIGKKGNEFKRLTQEMKLLQDRKKTTSKQLSSEREFHKKEHWGPTKQVILELFETLKRQHNSLCPPVPECEYEGRISESTRDAVQDIVYINWVKINEEIKDKQGKIEKQAALAIGKIVLEVQEKFKIEIENVFDLEYLENDRPEPSDELEALRKVALLATTDIRLIAVPYGDEREIAVEEGATETLTPVTPSNPNHIPSVVIACHSEFLAWKSEYFKVAMMGSFSEAEELRNDMQKGDAAPQFKIYNCTDAALVQMVRYTYTDECEVNGDIAAELLFLAMRCELQGLADTCEKYICDYIAEFDAIEVLMIGDLISSDKMRKIAIRAIIRTCSHSYYNKLETFEEIEARLIKAEIPHFDLADIMRGIQRY